MTRDPIPESAPAARPRRAVLTILAAILLIILIAGGVEAWRYFSVRESTDDAQIDGHINPISARVSGTVTAVKVEDNQYVEAGAVLVEIDPRDYAVALQSAEAELANAEAALAAAQHQVPITITATSSETASSQASIDRFQADVNTAQKEVQSNRARLDVAQAKLRVAQANQQRSARDLERMKQLIVKDEISQQQYDAAVAAADAGQAEVESAKASIAEAESAIETSQSRIVQSQSDVRKAQADNQTVRSVPAQIAIARTLADSAEAGVQRAEAALAQAKLNMEYLTVRAPVSGIVSKRNVEIGQSVQPGQPLMAILGLEDIWVTANFKETQLEHIRPQQRAVISVDAYGGLEYAAHVETIAAATGAKFSLLPPENATGNFVKVVQRVPVKIALENGQDTDHPLRPGMSVVVTVFIR